MCTLESSHLLYSFWVAAYCLFCLEHLFLISTCTSPGLTSNSVPTKKPFWIYPMHWDPQASRKKKKSFVFLHTSSFYPVLSSGTHISLIVQILWIFTEQLLLKVESLYFQRYVSRCACLSTLSYFYSKRDEWN